MKKSPLEQIRYYHDRTKHHLDHYALGPGGMDWKNQPNPFRSYSGCEITQLPLLTEPSPVTYADLYHPERFQAQPVTLITIAQLLQLSLGLSAWKQYGGNRWALRCNPSSGNLHPTEAYILCNQCEGLSAGLYHYLSRDHRLELRCQPEDNFPLPHNSLVIGLSSIFWREAWKYGERAFRYCQHDAGHAIAAIRYASATLGWKAEVLAETADVDNAALLGIDRDQDFQEAEREHPDVLLKISVETSQTINVSHMLRVLASAQWSGQANRLSEQHTNDWPIIEQTAQAAAKPQTASHTKNFTSLPQPLYHAAHPDISASTLIQQRRSAQQFHPDSLMSQKVFYRLLDLTLPRTSLPPWDAMCLKPCIHLVIFVHNIDGLTPGLYLFSRHKDALTSLRKNIQGDFEWAKPEDCPEQLDFYCLLPGDARAVARTLSCHQEIASDSAVSFAMLAEFEDQIQHPWQYRQLFWEAGMLGQLFYLEAESCGLRGTGIGCYFDDAVHEVLGLSDHTFQDLYHFTIGQALDDPRLQTIPPYEHLQTKKNVKNIQ